MYDLIALNKAVIQSDRPHKFFLDTFFRKETPSPANKIKVDNIKTKKRQVAPIVYPVSDGKVLDKQGYSTYELEAPYINVEHFISVEDLSVRQAGSSPYIELQTSEDLLNDKMGRYLAYLDDTVARTVEYMAVKAVLEGKLDLQRQDGSKLLIDFKRDSEHSITLSSKKWNSSDADIISNLREWRRLIKANSGEQADTLVMGSDALNAFWSNEKILKTYSQAGLLMGSAVTGQVQDNGAVYYGYIPEFGHIYGYEESYYDAVTKKNIPLIPVNTVVYIASRAQNYYFHGAVNNFRAGGLVAMEQFIDYREADNGKGAVISIESAPLPALTDPNSTVVAKVL